MSNFNSKEFGRNIRIARKMKGLTQDQLGFLIGKDGSSIGRFENGDVSPTAKDISKICKELDVEPYQLFETNFRIKNTSKNINPFKTDTLFLYYIGYEKVSKKYIPFKIKLKLHNNNGICTIDYTSVQNDKIYLSGYILADDNIAFCIFENNKEVSPRLEVGELIINISSGTDNIMIGSYTGTNGQYIPSFRKCLISKENYEKCTDEMLKLLNVDEKDIEILKEYNILYLNLSQPYEFE